MAEKAGAKPPAAWAETDDPALLARLAGNDALAPEARLAAAERAFAAGALDVETLQTIYRSVPGSPQQYAKLLTLEDEQLSPESRALFFQAIEQAQQPAEQARLLHRLLE